MPLPRISMVSASHGSLPSSSGATRGSRRCSTPMATSYRSSSSRPRTGPRAAGPAHCHGRGSRAACPPKISSGHYADVLGLEPVEERPGGLRYQGATGSFSLFESTGRASGEHTQLAFVVDDLETTVRELRARGVVFEEVDVPGLHTINGMAEVEGNYPSSGASGERAAWFRDSEGNLLGIGQPI